MRLPNGEQAEVEDRKLWGYILNPRHPEGAKHAILFQKLLGIDLGNWKLLKAELLRGAIEGEALVGKPSPYGQKYEVRFRMRGLRGEYTILSVWIVPANGTRPRLVTAYVE